MKWLIVLALFLIPLASADIEIYSSEEAIQRTVDIESTALNSFLRLDDTPDSYAGSSGECVAVNAGGTALFFENCTTLGGGGGDGGNSSWNQTQADDLYVNEAGDTMTGALTMERTYINITNIAEGQSADLFFSVAGDDAVIQHVVGDYLLVNGATLFGIIGDAQVTGEFTTKDLNVTEDSVFEGNITFTGDEFLSYGDLIFNESGRINLTYSNIHMGMDNDITGVNSKIFFGRGGSGTISGDSTGGLNIQGGSAGINFKSKAQMDATLPLYFNQDNAIYGSGANTLDINPNYDDGVGDTGVLNLWVDEIFADDSGGGGFGSTMEGILTLDVMETVDIGNSDVVLDSTTDKHNFTGQIDITKGIHVGENASFHFENNTGVVQVNCVDWTTKNQSGDVTGWRICGEYSGSNSIDLKVMGYGGWYNALQFDYVDFTNEWEISQGSGTYYDDSDYNEYIIADSDNTLDFYSLTRVDIESKALKLQPQASAPFTCNNNRRGSVYYDDGNDLMYYCNSTTWRSF